MPYFPSDPLREHFNFFYHPSSYSVARKRFLPRDPQCAPLQDVQGHSDGPEEAASSPISYLLETVADYSFVLLLNLWDYY